MSVNYKSSKVDICTKLGISLLLQNAYWPPLTPRGGEDRGGDITSQRGRPLDVFENTCGQFHWFFEASTEFGPSPFVSVATNSGILRWTLTQIKRWNKPNKSMSTA